RFNTIENARCDKGVELIKTVKRKYSDMHDINPQQKERYHFKLSRYRLQEKWPTEYVMTD
ncbi:MAG: hypothetical protein ACW7DY_21265, partial [Paraglaciecola chathamensis]